MTTAIEPATTSPPGESLRRSRATFLLLLLVLTAGAGLRAWYASGQLHINRFEDERYSLRNVRKVLLTGDFEPASAYYPSPVFNLPQVLALKASQSLSDSMDAPALATHDGRGKFTPTAFLITRLYQVLCGVLTLWLAFLVGRRLASPGAGLLAATVLAFMPWMIHASGYNKPDALLVMSVLLSLHAALRAVDATRNWPSSRRSLVRTCALWAWAGVCVALAMSAKITGGFAAIPLMTGALLAPGERTLRLRRFGLLVLAGATSALAFVLMNPYWRAYLYFLRGLQRDYAGRTEASRLEIPWKVASMHLDRFFLGPVLGTLALLAFVGCALWLVVRWHARDSEARATGLRWVQLAMLLAYPLLYAAAYAAQTPYFKPNNFLPTVPFTVLALAVWVDTALRETGIRWPDRRVQVRAIVAVALLAMVVPGGWRYVFHSRVPTTLDVVVAQLNEYLEPAAGHVVFMERWTPPPIRWDGTRPLHKGLSSVVQVDDLGELSQDVVDLAAAVVLVRPKDGDSDPLLESWPTSLRWRVEPIPFRYRGPELEVVLRAADRHSINLVASACGESCLQADLPDDKAGDEVVSIFVLLPWRVDQPVLVLGDREVVLHRASTQKNGVLFASPRVRLPNGVSDVRIVDDDAEHLGASADSVQIELHRWTPSPNQKPPPDLRK